MQLDVVTVAISAIIHVGWYALVVTVAGIKFGMCMPCLARHTHSRNVFTITNGNG